jgi:hypothetical protein
MSPVLSETESNARRTGRGMDSFLEKRPGTVRAPV